MRNVRTRLQTLLGSCGTNYASLWDILDQISLHEWRKVDEIDLDQALSILELGYCKNRSREVKIRMLKEEAERRSGEKWR